MAVHQLQVEHHHILDVFEAEQGPFAVGFAGEDITGDWTLSIGDDVGGDSGTLLDYEITFTVTAPPPPGGGGGGTACSILCPVDITASTDPFSDCDAYVSIDPVEITGDCDLQTW